MLIEKHGSLRAAVEIKSASTVGGGMLSGLRAFAAEHPEVPRFVVCTAPEPFATERARVIPWRRWFEMLPEIL